MSVIDIKPYLKKKKSTSIDKDCAEKVLKEVFNISSDEKPSSDYSKPETREAFSHLDGKSKGGK